MKKIISFLFVLIFCFATIACASTNIINKPSPPTQVKNDFKFYADHFQNIISNVKKINKNYKKYLAAEEAQELCNLVSYNIISYLKANRLYVLRQPKVEVFKLTNGEDVAFVLLIEIRFLDRDSSFRSLPNSLIIVKKFLIFFGSKKAGVGI